MHIDCESNGGIPGLTFLIQDPKYKYWCPWCRQGATKPAAAFKQHTKRERKFLNMLNLNELEIDTYKPTV